MLQRIHILFSQELLLRFKNHFRAFGSRVVRKISDGSARTVANT